jgi:hypothetical protein
MSMTDTGRSGQDTKGLTSLPRVFCVKYWKILD